MLKRLYPDYMFPSIQDIDKDFFRRLGIRFLIMDIDNTLVPYTCPEPTETALAFLHRLEQEDIKSCFISNNHKERVERFNQSLGLPYIYDAKKPFISAIKKSMHRLDATPAQTALLGDQLFTDILAGNRAKLTTILVNPIEPKETPFFALKRKYEKIVLEQMKKEKNHA